MNNGTGLFGNSALGCESLPHGLLGQTGDGDCECPCSAASGRGLEHLPSCAEMQRDAAAQVVSALRFQTFYELLLTFPNP